ncbi:MAG TPA: mannose-1-phosphate guanylyltransferase [Alphaproteobacteria bacterium]|nr:mannose-1-phosphate guanylyltransferase [Alphaproteobacteria bacterium]
MRIIPVILCGGSGTRLWPESREDLPKQFLNLIDHHSLLRNTVDRALKVSHCPAADIVCVCLESLSTTIQSALKDAGAAEHILCEPMARNTAAAVALAARYCQEMFGADSYMWVLPSDHYIGKLDVLEAALHSAVKSADDNKLVTFGITPTRPETGYGYIKCEKSSDLSILPVEKFVEKPDLQTAVSFLQDGSYYWNSGMFLFQTNCVVESFKALAIDVFDGVESSISVGHINMPDEDLYSQVPKIPFDKAIMEKSSDVTVIPCDMAWSDVGTWESIWEISPKTEENNVTTGDVVTIDSENCLIRSNSGRLVAVAGIENIVVIDTNDTVLITCKDSSDPLKKLVEKMKAEQRDQLYFSSRITKPL